MLMVLKHIDVQAVIYYILITLIFINLLYLMSALKQVLQRKYKMLKKSLEIKQQKQPQSSEFEEKIEKNPFEDKKKKNEKQEKTFKFNAKPGFQPHKKHQKNRQEDHFSNQQLIAQASQPADIIAQENSQLDNWSQAETKKSQNSSFIYRDNSSFKDSSDST